MSKFSVGICLGWGGGAYCKFFLKKTFKVGDLAKKSELPRLCAFFFAGSVWRVGVFLCVLGDEYGFAGPVVSF